MEYQNVKNAIKFTIKQQKKINKYFLYVNNVNNLI